MYLLHFPLLHIFWRCICVVFIHLIFMLFAVAVYYYSLLPLPPPYSSSPLLLSASSFISLLHAVSLPIPYLFLHAFLSYSYRMLPSAFIYLPSAVLVGCLFFFPLHSLPSCLILPFIHYPTLCITYLHSLPYPLYNLSVPSFTTLLFLP